MGVFDSYKTRIFPGINDTTIEATEQQASNGSSLIKKINDLCDTLNTFDVPENVEVTEIWAKFTSFYLDTVNGNDSNNGYEETQPKRTVISLLDLMATKQVGTPVSISVIGEINETLDFSKVKKAFSVEYGGFDIYISKPYEKNCVIKHGKDIVKTNANSSFAIRFTEITFVADQSQLRLQHLKNKIAFNYCTFQATLDTYGSLLFIEECSLIEITSYNSEDFAKGDSGCNYAITCCHNSNLYLDGITFNDFPVAISIFGFSTVVNYNTPIFFNNCYHHAEMYSKGDLLTNYPESFINNLGIYGVGEFNTITSEKFVLSQASDTIISLYKNTFIFEKILEFQVNSLPPNTSIKLFVDSRDTGLTVTSENLLVASIGNNFPYFDRNETLKVQIIGTIPNNTIISIDFVEIIYGYSSNDIS